MQLYMMAPGDLSVSEYERTQASSSYLAGIWLSAERSSIL